MHVLNTVVFFGVSYLSNSFNRKVANYGLLIPGAVISAANFYMRSFNNSASEQQLRHIYKQEFLAYEKFFRDKGLDEYE